LGKPCRDLLYTVQAPIGYSMARRQPMLGFVINCRARWDETVRPLCNHFEELGRLHNRGEITVKEFEDRKAELTAGLRALAAQRAHLDMLLDSLRADGRGSGPRYFRAGSDSEQRLEQLRADVEHVVEVAAGIMEDATRNMNRTRSDEGRQAEGAART
jgi:hypothetical protein